MQIKRGAITDDNSNQIINELTEKSENQSKEIMELRNKEAEFNQLKDLFSFDYCEYYYAEKEWIIPGSLLELFFVDPTERKTSIYSVIEELNFDNKSEVINRLKNAIDSMKPTGFSCVLILGNNKVVCNLKGKPVSIQENRYDKYILAFTLIQYDEPEPGLTERDLEPTVKAYEKLPLAYYRIDNQLRWVYVNKNWEDMYGYTLKQVKGKTVDYFLPEYVREKVNDTIKEVFSGKEVSDEFSLLDKNNKIRYYSTNIFPLYDENKNIIGAEGFNTDITRLREVEENFKIQKEKYNIISQNIPVVVYSRIPGEDNQLLFVSGRISELSGYKVSDFFDRKGMWNELIYFEDYKNYKKKTQDQITGHNRLNIEYRIKTKNNETKWVRDVSTPFLDEKGNVIKINGFIEDISDRKKAERALKLSEKKFRSVFEDSKDCIYLTTEDGQFIDINSAGLKLTGYTKEELLTKNASSLYVDIADRFRFKRILEKENYVKDFEFRLRKKDGEIRDCILTSSVSKNDFGEIKGYQGIIRDVTERKKVEREIIAAKEEAETADRIKTEFLAQMSHEIRTPINTILSFSSLINDEIREIVSPQSQEYFSILDRAGIRIIRTIDLILNMSELQSGSYKYILQDIDLSAILYDLFIEYKSHASDKKLQLNLHVDDDNLTVNGDEYSITQIISNLIDNAIKYTESGYVNVIAARHNSYTELIVEDSGIGISDRYIPNLFDAFSQEEQGYTRKFEGSGLGLALVKKYCDINKAKISVESIKGEGSRFIIHFTSGVDA